MFKGQIEREGREKTGQFADEPFFFLAGPLAMHCSNWFRVPIPGLLQDRDGQEASYLHVLLIFL